MKTVLAFKYLVSPSQGQAPTPRGDPEQNPRTQLTRPSVVQLGCDFRFAVNDFFKAGITESFKQITSESQGLELGLGCVFKAPW